MNEKTKKQKILEAPSFGEKIKWTAVADPKSYYPTRFEYMFGKALQGLVVGRATKDIRVSVKNAIDLAAEAEKALDKAQD